MSLSVRPVTGFILRLAQTLHRFGDRCEVVAFVDRPVRVTTALRSAAADSALAAVLAADGLDLAATSDYGRMFGELLGGWGFLAVFCAALGNKGGLNLVVTYEAFAPKILSAVRQELIFARHQAQAGRPPGWLGVPLVLTSHTWENAKNE